MTNSPPAGYNIGNFDIPFLENFFLKQGNKFFGSYFRYKCIDPFQILQFIQGLDIDNFESMKLGSACIKYDIPIKAHDAMSDIEATKKLVHKIREVYFK